MRVVSLVPSLTELVCWFGLGDSLVGRTRFCTEPAGEIEAVATVGGTKTPNLGAIVELAPDLVLANREENRREDVEALREAGLEVMVTDPNTVEDALTMIADLGASLSVADEADELIAATHEAMAEVPRGPSPRVFVPIWPKPLMALAADTYGHDLICRAGGTNTLAGSSRYPEITMDEVAALTPDLVLLPDEPYPFSEGDVPPFAAVAPSRLIDGKLLWWYGPRMPGSIRALSALFQEVSQ